MKALIAILLIFSAGAASASASGECDACKCEQTTSPDSCFQYPQGPGGKENKRSCCTGSPVDSPINGMTCRLKSIPGPLGAGTFPPVLLAPTAAAGGKTCPNPPRLCAMVVECRTSPEDPSPTLGQAVCMARGNECPSPTECQSEDKRLVARQGIFAPYRPNAATGAIDAVLKSAGAAP